MLTEEFVHGMHTGSLNTSMSTASILEKHQDMVRTLAKSGEAILSELTPDKAHLMHMAMGIAGEAGELLDAVKKHVIYGKDLDIRNVIEELGDIEFYMEGLRDALCISRKLTLVSNFNKLEDRYKGLVYTNEAAINRADKVEE